MSWQSTGIGKTQTSIYYFVLVNVLGTSLGVSDRIQDNFNMYIFFVLALLWDCSLCWDHWEVEQTPHTNQALP